MHQNNISIDKSDVINKIIEIKDKIIERRIGQDDDGLFTGEIGILLFLSYYNKYFNDDSVYVQIDMRLDHCINKLATGFYYPTYCSGVSGMLLSLDYMNKNNFIELEFDQANRIYRKMIAQSMLMMIKKGNYDFLHGAIGMAIFLLKCGGKEEEQNLSELLILLENIGIQKNETIKWECENDLKKTISFNISMSHGMASIAIFLSLMIELNIEKEKSLLLLNKTINYILQQEIDPQKYGSCFPTTSLESEYPNVHKSRLAWCYGDLGVAISLWRAGCSTNNEKWKTKALDTFNFASTRRNMEENSVIDGQLCHGTSGIAQVFRRMYFETGNYNYMGTSNYWIKKTLEIATWEDGFAGYKFLTGYPDSSWNGDCSFLEGIAGIGLALIASIGDSEYSVWDEFLLLS